MKDKFAISIIIPFFNSEKNILNCINSLKKQNIKDQIELIFIDDDSSDNSIEIIKNSKLNNFRIIKLNKNSGPSVARNNGLKSSSGKYVFFLDADDSITASTLKNLYLSAEEGSYDMVFCDKQRVSGTQNFRDNIFAFNTNRNFDYQDISHEIIKRITDPEYTVGVAGCHGKLIKRSIINNYNIFFEEKLRFLEDEIFIIDVLGRSTKIKYIREQMYVYNINPDIPTGRSNAFNYRFPVSNFKLMKDHVANSLRARNYSEFEIFRYGNQAMIYYLIYTLISYSLCIFRGKIDYKIGVINRRKIISEIIKDPEIVSASKNYKRSKLESYWLPKAIRLKSISLIELACNWRTKNLLRKIKK